MDKPKILIMVLACQHGEFMDLWNAIRATWGSVKRENIEVLYYHGYFQGSPFQPEAGGVCQTNDLIMCGYDETYKNIGRKTFGSFEHVLATYEFDYIFRCCLGSYIDQDQLTMFLSDKPREKFYCGIDGGGWASGSGYFLSRDVVQTVVDHKDEWNLRSPDDVALGTLLSKHGITVTPGAKRINMHGDFVYEPGHYHYHFRKNVPFMHKCHKVVYKDKLKALYKRYCRKRSDINQHLPTLLKYAFECDHITEMGVRYGVSTWAFLQGEPSTVVSYDIRSDFFKDERLAVEIAKANGIHYEFNHADTLNIIIDETDLLFIDTLHTYNQLSRELRLHAEKAKKYIILHDTQNYGRRDEYVYAHASDIVTRTESTKHGLLTAVDDFLEGNKEWQIKDVYKNNNGLLVMERV